MTNHCTSLEISKQLKESGWTKEIEFVWAYNSINKVWKIIKKDNIKGIDSIYPAPLATEILEELPASIEMASLEIAKSSIQYYVSYNEEDRHTIISFEDKSLPNALAKMWLYSRKEKIYEKS